MIATRRRGEFGFPYTVDPGIIRSGDALPMPANAAAIYGRVRDAGPVSKIALRVGTNAGNISVAVYRNSGFGRAAVPGAQIATSGTVACPSSGYAEVALLTPTIVRAGDWFGLSASSTTATFTSLLALTIDNSMGNGRQYRQATAHPLPATPSGLVATQGFSIVLIGVQ